MMVQEPKSPLGAAFCRRRRLTIPKAAIITLFAAAVLLAIAGNFLFFLCKPSATINHFYGGENNYERIVTRLRQTGPNVPLEIIAGGNYQWSLLLFPTFAAIKKLGFSFAAFAMMPALGLLLGLVFSYLIAARLGGGEIGGWLAAALLALSPLGSGVARSFNPWSLIIGCYLALTYAAVLYSDRPSAPRAVAVGALVAANLWCAQAPTTLVVVFFYAVAPLLWCFWRAISERGLPGRNRAMHLGLMLIPVFLWFHFIAGSTGVGFGYGHFLTDNLNFTSRKHSTLYSLGGYFVAGWCCLLGPITAVVMLAGLLFYPRRPVNKQHLVWLILPLAALIGFSFVVKKNTWYVLESLALLSAVAAVTCAAWLSKLHWTLQLLLCALLVVALGWQYNFFFHHSFFPDNGAWLRHYYVETIFTSGTSVAPIFP